MDYKEKYLKYKIKYNALRYTLNNSIESDLVPKSLTSNKIKYLKLFSKGNFNKNHLHLTKINS